MTAHNNRDRCERPAVWPLLAGFMHSNRAMNETTITRRDAIRRLGSMATGLAAAPLCACRGDADDGAPAAVEAPPAAEWLASPDEDPERLRLWVETLRREGFASPDRPFGAAAIRVGELAIGTPYEAYTLEEYIRAGDSPARTEPLTLSLSKFDCVSLVESCLAVARIARTDEPPTWEAFGREMERMRYRGGVRGSYASRLHYFSEWLDDNERRGLVRQLGRELGGIPDERPLRFMSSNPDSYPALAYPEVRDAIVEMERSLDTLPRWVIPTARIPDVVGELESGDILAFATSIPGLDVTHAAFAYRDQGGTFRVLHAPLSGGVVEITRTTVPEYVAAISRATGILVARPLPGPASSGSA